MNINLSVPKGTRDFYPEDMLIREYIFNSWEKSCKKYGFEKFDAPMFEHLEVYTKKSGDEIEKQLYAFEDKGGRKIALRPEMTPSLARMVAAKGQSIKKPIRWYSIPRLFRYEKMQKGRLREFFQLNMDILGLDSEVADAELIAAAIDLLRDLKLSKEDFSVHISSRNLLEELLIHQGVLKNSLADIYSLLDKRHKIGEEIFDIELMKIIDNDSTVSKIKEALSVKTPDEIAEISPNLPALVSLRELFSLLNRYGLEEFVEFDVGIVRGLAYYTGTVFEIFDKQRSMRAIAGGGRYDKLVELYGGPTTPAIGFAAGDVVLADILREKNLLPNKLCRSEVFVVSFDKTNYAPIIELATTVRQFGISCEFSMKLNAVGKQMKQATSAGAKIVVFAGGEEENENKVKIKIMSTGEEKIIAKDNLKDTLKKHLAEN